MTVRAIEMVMSGPWAITAEAMETVNAIVQRANDTPEAVRCSARPAPG